MCAELFRVEPGEIVFPPTYISAESSLVVKLFNKTDKIINFHWRNFASIEDEQDFFSKVDINDSQIRSELPKLLQFSSPDFSIEPLRGEIWPQRSINIFVKFTPTNADLINTVGYITDEETGERLPVTICGRCLPPQAAFSVGTIHAGHVSLDFIQEYEVIMKNTGEAPLDFYFDTQYNNCTFFEFSPLEGHIDIGGMIPIRIKFKASKVGQFNEEFQYKIHGLKQGFPRISIYGRVIGPSFKVNTRIIDFGEVSYGFLNTKVLQITNTSDIPLDFNFKFPCDGSFQAREFQVIPDTGVVEPFSSLNINVEFIPINIQEYHTHLIMTNPKFQEILQDIPVSANCFCPTLSLDQTELDIGEVFINHIYNIGINIVNQSRFRAKYDFFETIDPNEFGVNVMPNQPKGIVEPHVSHPFDMKFSVSQLGKHCITKYIKVFGNDQSPLLFTIKCLCIGPRLEFSTKSLSFGEVEVLKDHSKPITIHNNSLIPANYKVEPVNETSNFYVENREGSIPPNGSLDLIFHAKLDDTVGFSAAFQLCVEYLSPIKLEVKAKGIGKFIIPSIPLDTISVGNAFAGEAVKKEFYLDNQGRRGLDVRWGQGKPIVTPETTHFSYRIEPEHIFISAHTKEKFVMTIEADSPCTFEFTAPLTTSSKNKRSSDLYAPVVTGQFNRVILQFEKPSLTFVYTHDVEAEEAISGREKSNQKTIGPSQSLLTPIILSDKFTNNSELALHINVTTPPAPFSIDVSEFTLEPGETMPFNVTFDPSFKRDFSSEVIEKKIAFEFVGNPQRYCLDCKAFLIFPNLNISNTNVDFGSLMLNTEQTSDVVLKNISKVKASYYWEMMTTDGPQVFDVFPLRGTIDSGNSEEIHFTFYAAGDENGKSASFERTAICHVIGGPDYPVLLKGSSAAVKYSIEPKMIDFGTKPSNDPLSSTFTLSNNSDFAISYSVVIPKSIQFTDFICEPMKGSLPAKDTVTFRVDFLTVFPRKFSENIFVRVGQYEEVRIDIKVNAEYPRLLFDAPRDPTSDPGVLALQTKDKNELSLNEVKILSDKLAEILKRPSYIAKLKAKKDVPVPKLFAGTFLGSYLVDLGDFMLGLDKSVDIPVKVIGRYAQSFEILDKALKGSGLSITPTSFRDIKPRDTISFKVAFDPMQRSKENLTELDFNVPVIMNEDFGYMLHIKANITVPSLIISKSQLQFDNTIVGQARVLSIQLQNMNPVPCEYTIQNAEIISQRPVKTPENIFTASPTTGILPPASFQNIDITFAPGAEKSYTMQFPIKIKYNSKPKYISVKGTGVQMKLQFEPSKVVFKPAKPFCPPESVIVKLINPTKYPIDVYSRQFDSELLEASLPSSLSTDSILMEKPISPPITPSNGSRPPRNLSNTLTSSKPNSAPKTPELKERPNQSKSFSVAVIVHGPPQSGKTTVAKQIASHMGDISIISLKEVWADMPENSKGSDYVAALSNYISHHDYVNGFIFDGLDGFQEPPESEAFLLHAIKAKNVSEELANNPLFNIPHKEVTGYEAALSYVLEVLTGHYVIMVALNVTESDMSNREAALAKEERANLLRAMQEELSHIFSMTEEEYMALSEEERESVDKKREAHRSKLIEGDIISRESRAQSKRGNSSSKSKQPGSIKKPKGKASLIPSDPRAFKQMVFQYTLGSVVAKVSSSGGNYQSINIDDFLGRNDPPKVEEVKPSQTEEEEETKNEVEEKPKNEEEEEEKEEEKEKEKEEVVEVPEKIEFIKPRHADGREPIKQNNVLVVYGSWDKDEVQLEVNDFIPTLNELKEKAFSLMIEPPRLIKTPAIQTPMLSNTVLPEFQLDCQGSAYLHDDSGRIMVPRWHIEPNSSAEVAVLFGAKQTGVFMSELSFGILDAKSPVFKLPVEGVISHPDIDRNIQNIFQKIVPKLTPKTEMAYVTALGEFHFGSLIVTNGKPPKGQIAQYTTTLKITNPTEFDIEIEANLSENGAKCPWVLSKTSASIKANSSYDLIIGFHPVNPDCYRNTLTLTVKDQPEPLQFKFVAYGCAPEIELSNVNVDFEKLLVKQEKTIPIELKNSGRIPAFWKVKGGNTLGSNFEMNALEGLIAPRASFNFEIKYSSQKPFNIKKAIQIDIFDKTKSRQFGSAHVNVVAETFDANFELVFPKGTDNLNFGEMKVNRPCNLQLGLKCKGKYPMDYKFVLGKAALRNLFTITPAEGQVPPGDKPTMVGFVFQSREVSNYACAKGISLKMIDSVTGTEVATVPIPFSAKTVFSSFTFDPDGDVDFGALPVNTSFQKTINLRNDSVFPFDFEIISKVPENPETPFSQKSKKRNTQTKNAPRKATKKNSVAVEDFIVSPSSGTVQPGESAPILIEFTTSRATKHESPAAIKITDSHPQYADGVPITFKASTYVPAIVTSDFESMFAGQRMGVRSDLQRVDNNTFLIDEKLYHFKTVMVGKKAEVEITMTNVNPIPCTVQISTKAPAKGVVVPFELSRKLVEIAPKESESFIVTYNATESGEFTANLEMSVKGGVMYSIGLEASATTPNIEVLYDGEPITEPIRFNQVLVGFKKERTIIVRNNGILPTTLLFTKSDNPDFTVDVQNTVVLDPHRALQIPVVLSPAKVRKASLDLVMEIVENGKKQTINFQGEGNQEEVIFEGFERDMSDLIFKDTICGCHQKVTFTIKNVSKDYVRFAFNNQCADFTFTPKVGHIRPNSEKTISAAFFTDKPVKYNPYKLSCQWTKIQILNEDGTPMKIAEDDPSEIREWDDSMATISYVPRRQLQMLTPTPPPGPSSKATGRKLPPHRSGKASKRQPEHRPSDFGIEIDPSFIKPLTETNQNELVKVTHHLPEPNHATIPGKYKDIQLKVFAAADQLRYSLDQTELDFPPTMMFDVRKYHIELANTSQIAMDYRWFVANFNTLHGNYALTLPPPFSVEPATGTIPAGTTAHFNVVFMPREVDEFSATLQCEIPFLFAADPPQIKVTGMSRRPICHFDVQCTDYLKAKRRLPEFKYELPPDVRVIEIVAPILTKVSKKFDILNTTAMPYEVKWVPASDYSSGSVTCETQRTLISSGKAFTTVFAFTPTSMKTVESLWTFTIPQYNVKVPLLVVGRAIPK